MTRTFIPLFMLLGCVHCMAQAPYGNEWIDYGQTYVRIPVVETGTYQITAAELARVGIPVDSMAVSGIQMFVQGAETSIEVVGNTSGRLGPDGYIVFAGKRNDGYTDTALYTRPEAMPHSYYNLYSDTTAYFLTWRPGSGTGLRALFPKPNTVTDTAAFHWEEAMQLFTSHYLPGRFFPAESDYENGSLLTAYDEGEGWTGPPITEPFTFTFQTQNLLKSGPATVKCEMMVAGWTPGTHSAVLWLGTGQDMKSKLLGISLTDRERKRIVFDLEIRDFDAHGQVLLTLTPTSGTGKMSVSYARIRYPQAGPHLAPAYLRTLPSRTVKFIRLDPETEYLIITHPLIHTPASDPIVEYVTYRSSARGGGYRTSAVDSQELYDQFNAGQPGPTGIRNAIRFLHDTGKLQFVLLAGRSVDPQKARKMKDSWQVDMVPNAGWPGSDVALATGNASHVPLVAIGRINAQNPMQLRQYLRKVQAMEAEQPTAAWRYGILHLSGGRSRDELLLFKSYIESFEKRLQASPLSNRVTSITKLTDSEVEPVYIDKHLNAGVGLITLFGHSGLDVTDIDIGRADDPGRNYRNHPRYPAVIVNGCAAGSIFYANQTLSSNWIFAPESGAVLFLAHTFNGPSSALKRYTGYMYDVLADVNFSGKPFGQIQLEAIRRNLLDHPGILDSIAVQQMLLHGDPAIRIFPAAWSIADSQNIPSGQPPAMLVTIDGRQVAHGEAISPTAILKIRIIDDHLPIMQNDSSWIAVWLKKQCTGCTDVRMPLREATGTNVAGRYYDIALPLTLTPGNYTLTIQCRDPEGNSPPPYQIGFIVPGKRNGVRASIAPNPFSQWFRLSVTNEHEFAVNLVLHIRNAMGTTVLQKVLNAHTGENEWFFSPGAFAAGLPAALPAGLYYYTISPVEATGGPSFYFESASGHLFYSP